MMDYNVLKNEIQKELARRALWDYCKLKAPDFYKEDRAYLKEMCTTLQDFVDDDNSVLILNLPPRHGKSRTAGCFVEWLFGQSVHYKVITASYNSTLSTLFSKSVRNTIQELKASDRLVYTDLFPNVKVKRGDGAADLWGLVGSSTNSYLATAPNATVTGLGGDFIIVDDIIKNAYEANNENIKKQHWTWFTDTMLSRLEGKRKVILIMTRWASDDLSGMVEQHFEKLGMKVKKIVYKACDNDKMLCEEILSLEAYKTLVQTIGEDIAAANYNNEPINLKNCLYGDGFLLYDELPDYFESIDSYTDTADTGSDYLCSYIYGIRNGKAYMLDILYNQKSMEFNEPELAKKFKTNKVNVAYIESNNGGRGFGRNVQRITQQLGNNLTKFIMFTQTKNKNARILTGATGVMQNIYFPRDWKIKWRELATDLIRYNRTGKNAHDDCADALTGCYEKSLNNRVRISF